MNFTDRNQQRGAALITSLVIVLVISVLGISIARQVITQRKVSSSNYDQIVTFADAESGLQEGETVVEENKSDLPTLYALSGVKQAAFVSSDWWKTSGHWASAAEATNGGISLHGGPKYMIEDMGLDSSNSRRIFRITATATGAGGAETFLQSHYAILE
ncbi:pilus assembly PilX family protein [Psychromonas antarctica]|uniref:pilus assembly PilX family protein n=1 Tax=Psychromonas antarctica TaxID=67573 RepID=UPI001EE78D89|nr:PilX N-terminal domain-containing pilus assembly protein [Psychromonas antarctica]MCG6202382.1 PilX N-terminal domain-containing pilus assembly protein [Psychromonas antarctica]